IIMTTDVVKLYDIDQSVVININSDIKYSSKPIFHNDGFYFNAESGCKYYSLITKQLVPFETSGDLCFIDNAVLITKDNDYFKLMDLNSNIIGSVYLENCKYYRNLQAYQDSLFYFYGENKLIDDEDAVYKVDFRYLYIEKLTDNGANTFIMSINSFQ
ncbi:MAG: hypothetical protein L6407_03225, partial [Candidatus Delongbacteria bacterium]|nr:hypothetical protein [Candidatus Delongbacteria bacterium]